MSQIDVDIDVNVRLNNRSGKRTEEIIDDALHEFVSARKGVLFESLRKDIQEYLDRKHGNPASDYDRAMTII